LGGFFDTDCASDPDSDPDPDILSGFCVLFSEQALSKDKRIRDQRVAMRFGKSDNLTRPFNLPVLEI